MKRRKFITLFAGAAAAWPLAARVLNAPTSRDQSLISPGCRADKRRHLRSELAQQKARRLANLMRSVQ
jgi:hypothetical protein